MDFSVGGRVGASHLEILDKSSKGCNLYAGVELLIRWKEQFAVLQS